MDELIDTIYLAGKQYFLGYKKIDDKQYYEALINSDRKIIHLEKKYFH